MGTTSQEPSFLPQGRAWLSFAMVKSPAFSLSFKKNCLFLAALGLPCYSQNLVIVAHGLSYPKTCGIFPDQGLNLCSLNWQVDSKPLDHQRSPLIFISVLFSCSVMSHSLQLQHARLPGACSNSCPSSRWCHPTILSSVIPFSACLQSFPASGSFPMSRLLS